VSPDSVRVWTKNRADVAQPELPISQGGALIPNDAWIPWALLNDSRWQDKEVDSHTHDGVTDIYQHLVGLGMEGTKPGFDQILRLDVKQVINGQPVIISDEFKFHVLSASGQIPLPPVDPPPTDPPTEGDPECAGLGMDVLLSKDTFDCPSEEVFTVTVQYHAEIMQYTGLLFGQNACPLGNREVEATITRPDTPSWKGMSQTAIADGAGLCEIELIAPVRAGTYRIAIKDLLTGRNLAQEPIIVVTKGGTFPESDTIVLAGNTLTINSAQIDTSVAPVDGYFRYKGTGTMLLNFNKQDQALGFYNVTVPPASDAEAKPVQISFTYNDCLEMYSEIKVHWLAYEIDPSSRWYHESYEGVDLAGKMSPSAAGSAASQGFFGMTGIDLRLTEIDITATGNPSINTGHFDVEGFNNIHVYLENSIPIGSEDYIKATLVEGLNGDVRWNYGLSEFDFGGIESLHVEMSRHGALVAMAVASINSEGKIDATISQGRSLPIRMEKFTITVEGLSLSFSTELKDLVGSFSVESAKGTLRVGDIDGVEGSFWGTANFGQGFTLKTVEVGYKSDAPGGVYAEIGKAQLFGSPKFTIEFEQIPVEEEGEGTDENSGQNTGKETRGSLNPIGITGSGFNFRHKDFEKPEGENAGKGENYLSIEKLTVDRHGLSELNGEGNVTLKGFQLSVIGLQYQRSEKCVYIDKASVGVKLGDKSGPEASIEVIGLKLQKGGGIDIQRIKGDLKAHPLYVKVDIGLEKDFKDETDDGSEGDSESVSQGQAAEIESGNDEQVDLWRFKGHLSAELGQIGLAGTLDVGSNKKESSDAGYAQEKYYRHAFGQVTISGNGVIPYTGLSVSELSGGFAWNYQLPNTKSAGPPPDDLCEWITGDLTVDPFGEPDYGEKGIRLGIGISDTPGKLFEFKSYATVVWGSSAVITLDGLVQWPRKSEQIVPIICGHMNYTHVLKAPVPDDPTKPSVPITGTARVQVTVPPSGTYKGRILKVEDATVMVTAAELNDEWGIEVLGGATVNILNDIRANGKPILKIAGSFDYERKSTLPNNSSTDLIGNIELGYEKMVRFPTGFDETSVDCSNLSDSDVGFFASIQLAAQATAHLELLNGEVTNLNSTFQVSLELAAKANGGLGECIDEDITLSGAVRCILVQSTSGQNYISIRGLKNVPHHQPDPIELNYIRNGKQTTVKLDSVPISLP